MSVAAAPLMHVPPGFRQPADHAVSTYSEQLRRLLRRVEEHLSLPLSAGRERTLQERLVEVALATAVPDWDGYAANPIRWEAILDAQLFIRTLPRSVRMPDIVPEPSGELGFEWRDKSGSVFVVSVSGRSDLTYAGVLGGGKKVHGEEQFTEQLPATILEILFTFFPERAP